MTKDWKKNNGFTLLELLVVLSLIGLLVLIAAPTYRSMRENVALDNYSQEVVNALRIAQQRSVVSQGGIVHGVSFEADDYTLFGGDPQAPDYTLQHQINSGIEISYGAGSQVIFTRLTGTTTDQTIILSSPNGREKIIKITPNGGISIP